MKPLHDDAAPAIDYDHRAWREIHSVDGALAVLRTLFPTDFPGSVLDVGCGIGSWLKAAQRCGASEVRGVEGADVPSELMHVPKTLTCRADLNRPIDLKRRFDLVICLETVEHLEPSSAETIVDSLVRHGDTILFSAAVPGQAGAHHVNCRWPAYWQELFNDRGFSCSDDVRWTIWDDASVEPWYRQNLMLVTRDEPNAGREPRIPAVVHPAMMEVRAYLAQHLRIVEAGELSWRWYVRAPLRAAAAKVRRLVRRR